MEKIESRKHAQWQRARSLLRSARDRREANQMVIEGSKLIRTYGESQGLHDATVLVSESGLLREEVQRVLDSFVVPRVYAVSQQAFMDLTELEQPEGILAMLDIPEISVVEPDDFRLLLDGIQDPGNLGTLLRSAAAAGATSVRLSKGCADVWSAKCLRGGMGAQFSLPVFQGQSAVEMLSGFDGLVLGTSADASKVLYELDLTGPVAMVFGSEGGGIGDEFQTLATSWARVPLAPRVESLNVAAAATLFMFERVRQVGGITE
jgi:RNA methyltransferase, TrmH family